MIASLTDISIDETVRSRQVTQAGFSLIELSLVLVIVALLSGGLMFGLSGQFEQAQNKEVQLQLDTLREALLGFAMINGRLPCPADPTQSSDIGGGESLQACTTTPHRAGCAATDQQCAREHGVIPWRLLGLREIDPWGNRFTYFVGFEFADPLLASETAAGTRSRFTLDTPGRANILDGAGNSVALALPAVFGSHGKNGAGAYQGTGAQNAVAAGNEAENADADLTFISQMPTLNFDDQFSWVIPTVLKSRLVSVGKLP